MYTSLTDNARFAASSVQKTSGLFCINHYAGPVVYSTNKFVEKNKDELPKEANDLFGKSSNALLRQLFFIPPVDPNLKATKAASNPSVCYQFKEQLASLVSKIESTQPHYVRCVKPNDKNKPDIIDRIRLVEQLRCGGVLEAVKVARSGFPYRMTHEDFYSRFRPEANPYNAQYSKLTANLQGQTKTMLMCQNLVLCVWDDVSAPKPGAGALVERKHRFMIKWKGKTSSAGISRDAIQIGKTKVSLLYSRGGGILLMLSPTVL